MIKPFVPFSLLFIHSCVFSQEKVKPSGIVLCPHERSVATELKDSIENFRIATEITEEVRAQFIPDKLPLNWKLVRGNELKIMANQDFFSSLSLQLERAINYKLIENYE